MDMTSKVMGTILGILIVIIIIFSIVNYVLKQKVKPSSKLVGREMLVEDMIVSGMQVFNLATDNGKFKKYPNMKKSEVLYYLSDKLLEDVRKGLAEHIECIALLEKIDVIEEKL